MMKHLIVLAALLVLYSMSPARAETAAADGALVPPKAVFSDLRLIDTRVVKRVIDPMRAELDDGGIVQLSGISVPGLELQEAGDIAVAANVFLKGFIEGKQVRLYVTKDAKSGRVNRMGYRLAHLERAEGDVWIEGLLLANGLARVYPSPRGAEMADAMLKTESEARVKKLGLWATATILTPADANKGLHSMAVVEGRVLKVGVYDNRVFLNFGDDWRRDFTIGIPPSMRRRLGALGLDPMTFAGRTVRIHGWIEEYNGPYIELTDPAWLEFLP